MVLPDFIAAGILELPEYGMGYSKVSFITQDGNETPYVNVLNTNQITQSFQEPWVYGAISVLNFEEVVSIVLQEDQLRQNRSNMHIVD